MDNFALKLNEWFRHYDPNSLEVVRIFQLIDFSNKKILEIGCATGKSTMQVYKNAEMYFGVDNDVRTINFCKDNYRKDNLFFLLNNAEDLLFKSEYFDIVYLPWVFNYIENKAQAVNELFRVLKPGGSLVLADTSGVCDYDDMLAGIIKNNNFDPELVYENIITKQFNLVQKTGPVEIPYIFPTFQKALELMKFIVEDYLEIKLNNKQIALLNKNLSQYEQKNGEVVFYEKPMFYLFTKE